MRILVNAISVKKGAGGMFQISTNFFLKTLEYKGIEWYYVASKDLDNVLGSDFFSLRDEKYFVFPNQPDFKHTYIRVKKELRELESRISPDVVYSICAPSYFTFNTVEVMRFTNPWVTHPNEYCWKKLSIKERIYKKIYCINQRRMMRKAYYFITQTETTKHGIMRITGVPSSHVKVVSNVLPAIYTKMDRTPIPDEKWINIAAVGNSFVHKNFDIIPDVLTELEKKGDINVRFHTTLPEGCTMLSNIKKELIKRKLEDHLVNHGFLDQSELCEMYRRCQFCFLPTLLEVFSASVIEAMFFNLPIVATNFDFNSSVLEDSCLYYNPIDASDAANKISELIHCKQVQEILKEKMVIQLSKYGDYNNHFNDIVDFLKYVVKLSKAS